MKIIKIAIFGIGVVGSHVVKLLEKNSYILNNTKFKIVSISAKNKNKKRNFNVKKYHWFKNFSDLSKNNKPDLIIETIGGSAKLINDLYKYCLKNKISLITANKAQLAENGHTFFGDFDKMNLYLGFEAAVLGAVPVVRAIEQSILHFPHTQRPPWTEICTRVHRQEGQVMGSAQCQAEGKFGHVSVPLRSR